MPNEVLIKIKVKDDSAEGYEAALVKAREFGSKLKDELEEAGRKAGDNAADEIKRELEELDPPSVQIDVDTEHAKEEIGEVKDDLERLHGEDIEIDVHLNDKAAEVEAKILEEKLKHELSGAGGSSAGSWGTSFTSALSKFDFKAGLMPVGIALGVALSPLLAAASAGAIVGGVGLGGIVGGIVVAAHDPRVQSAFKDMKSDLGDSLKIDAAPFVPVVIGAIKDIEATVKGLNLGAIFKDLAPQVQPVLNGVLSLVTSIGGALRNVAANSGPVMKELGNDFRDFGRTLQSGIDSLTDNGKQEAQALHDLFAIVDGGITVVFGLVNALTEVYGAFHKLVQISLPGAFELWQDKTQGVADAVTRQAQAAVDAATANDGLAGSAKREAAAAKTQADAINSVSDALKAQTDPAFALLDAQKQVNSATDAYNKAVKTSGAGSKQAKSANEDLQKAFINYVGAAGKARDGTGHLTDEQKALLKAAGASDGTIKGLDKTLQNAYKAAKKLDGFEIDVTYATTFKTYGRPVSGAINPSTFYHGLAHGGVSGAASGATSSGLTWTGERGPELLDLPPGTKVRTSGDSMRDAGAVAGGGMDGAGPIIVELHLDGHQIATAMVDPQRSLVRNRFGGSVQAAYGKG